MKPIDKTMEELVPRLSHLAGFKTRKMFGGASLYSEDVVFCLITRDGTPHLRIGDINLDDFINEGQKPFTPKMKNAKGSMPYYTIPEHVISDQVKLEAWVHKAIKAAKEAKRKK